jgi:hypothetical protein
LITGNITGSNSITGQRWSCPLSTTKNAKRGDDILPKNRYNIHNSWMMHTSTQQQQQGGESHYGLAIYILKYLKAKEELWKLKYFTIAKI